ncbi:hypothetical protein KCP74_17760 [Salmonella enterica subsp. enterica]|nr:hypothetical protein KCP74_17760 [Salmonella enterica subsp. enterica]
MDEGFYTRVTFTGGMTWRTPSRQMRFRNTFRRQCRRSPPAGSSAQYGALLELVADVNLAVLENNPKLHEQLANADELARLNVERHGAVVLAPQKNFLPCVGYSPSWGCASKLLRSLSGGRACTPAFRPH